MTIQFFWINVMLKKYENKFLNSTLNISIFTSISLENNNNYYYYQFSSTPKSSVTVPKFRFFFRRQYIVFVSFWTISGFPKVLRCPFINSIGVGFYTFANRYENFDVLMTSVKSTQAPVMTSAPVSRTLVLKLMRSLFCHISTLRVFHSLPQPEMII